MEEGGWGGWEGEEQKVTDWCLSRLRMSVQTVHGQRVSGLREKFHLIRIRVTVFICKMKIKNWTVCVQDRGRWRDVVEKAKTFNTWSSNAYRRSNYIHYLVYCLFVGRYSSLGIDSLRAGRSGERFPVGAKFSSPAQTGSEAHASSCTVVAGGLFPCGVKRQGAWRWQPTPS